MIKNKKIWAIVLSILILVVTIIPSSYTNAAGEFTVAGGTANVKAGQEVSVDVNLVNNPGISAINLYYTYDTNYLTLKNVENKISKFTMTNDITTVWDAASNYTEDGILATLTFEVAKDTPSGNYAIAINFLSASNDSFQSVTAQTTPATVTVEALPVAATGLTLNKNSLSLVTGDSETLFATISPDNATNKAVLWKSSDTTVATVDSNGKVTAMKKGTATITVTTEDGSFTDACEVSVACSHANTTIHPAVESTCLIQGNNTYTICDDCGIVVSGSDEKLPFASHKGGTATCKDKAVCTVCKKTYGDYTSHQLTNHSQNEANHNNTGNIAYWTCDVCNKYFSDAAGKNEIEQKDTVIDKVPHTYDTEWSHDGTQHWKECACGAKTELANHQFDNDCDTTCNAGCGYTRPITHQWKATYSTDENKHWYECEICGEKKEEGNHSGGTATCKDKAVCVVCDKAYGEFASHDMTEKVDATYLKAEANCVGKAVYYKSCSVCGTASADTFETGKVDSATHTGKTEVKDAVKETCTVDGYSGDVYCKDCGVKLEDGKAVPMGHKIIKVNAVSATHEKYGNIEYFVCSRCDKLFAEEDATTEITLADTIIKKQEVNVDNKLDSEKAESPKTYDSSMYIIWAVLLFISVSVFISMKVYGKKRRNFRF